jgi:hypothetical protein
MQCRSCGLVPEMRVHVRAEDVTGVLECNCQRVSLHIERVHWPEHLALSDMVQRLHESWAKRWKAQIVERN